MEFKIGDIKYYHDSGDRFKVEILAMEDKAFMEKQ
tara:strand:- start:2070 stop:2174 length:105 start_codon:yes stop_codon:yes gene_type:complete